MLVVVTCAGCLESDYDKLPANIRNFHQSVLNIQADMNLLEMMKYTKELQDGYIKDSSSAYVVSVIDQAVPAYQRYLQKLGEDDIKLGSLRVPKGFEDAEYEWRQASVERIAAAKAMVDGLTYANEHQYEANGAFNNALDEFVGHMEKARDFDNAAIVTFGKKAYR